jgi:dTDP-4-amino-4,6-dideoxygalactose transaminase
VGSADVVVPLVDLRAAFLPIREEIFREFARVLDGMELLLGPQVRAFEAEFAEYLGVVHGVGVSSGTDALQVALRACGVGPGDEVIVPSHTFFATVEAVLHAGATPVFVDVEPETLTLDVRAIPAALSSATRAIVPVHLYGHPADMDPILEIARGRDLRVVEDAAQAHGARYRGRRCGSLGDAGCFSFYVTKNLGALGEGGFVATNDAGIAERVRLLRHHGHVSKFEHALAGHNFRLDELQAVVLRARLRRLDAANARRRELAARYRALLADGAARALAVRPGCESVHHVLPVRVPERDALRDHLAKRGVETGIHYARPAHLQPALVGRPHRRLPLPVTEAACGEILSLPLYPELRDEQCAYVAACVNEFLAGAPGVRAVARGA